MRVVSNRTQADIAMDLCKEQSDPKRRYLNLAAKHAACGLRCKGSLVTVCLVLLPSPYQASAADGASALDASHLTPSGISIPGQSLSWNDSYWLWLMVLLILAILGMSGWIAINRSLALRSAHKQLELFFDSVAAILIVLDAHGKIIRWNSMAVSAFRLSWADVKGKDLSHCGIRWQGDLMEWDFWLKSELLDQRRELPFEQEGERRSLSFTVRSVQNLDREDLAGYLINAFDTTSHRALEGRLRNAQKLESIGQLAAGLAHEINTPIQFVGNNTQFLQEAFRDLETVVRQRDELLNAAKNQTLTPSVVQAAIAQTFAIDSQYLLLEIPKAIEQALEGIHRISTLISAMKEFSHPGTKAKVPVDLNRAIESTITVAGHEWRYVADLETDFDRTLPRIPCLPGELNQVILNLIVNAAHSIAEAIEDRGQSKGKITIRTRSLGDCVEIQIQDTGTGIPLDIQSRIFDPFFTTKEVGKGTGQGLAIAHALIVKRHGGNIRFTTEMGLGTTFFIELPLEGTMPETEDSAV